MKKCVTYANCQKSTINAYLRKSSEFSSRFQIVDVPPVQVCDQEAGIDEYLQDCDVFIYQNISDAYGDKLSTDNILKSLPLGCQTIAIPNAYFTGYFPQHISSAIQKPNSKCTTLPSGKFPYGDRNIDDLIKQQLPLNEIKKLLCSLDFYTLDFLILNIEKSLDELRRRELHCDLKISDFVADFYQNNYLFYTVNHPSHNISRCIAKRILDLLNLSSVDLDPIVIDPFKYSLQVPIYPSVIKSLGLSFASYDYEYSFYSKIDNAFICFEDYIDAYYYHAID